MNPEQHDHFGATSALQQRAYLGLLAAALLTLMAMLAYLVWSGYREALRDAEVTTQNLSLVLSSRLQGSLARIDAVLGELAHEVTPALMQNSVPVIRQQEISARMARQLKNFPDLSGTYYFNADGDMLYASDPGVRSANVADRPFFQHLRARPDSALEYSDPLVARTTGRLSLVIARGIRDDAGRFLGVTTALFDLENYARLLAAMNVGIDSSIVLRRSDTFALVTRYPPLPAPEAMPLVASDSLRQQIAAGQPSGTLNYRESHDGALRLSSFRVIEPYPFYLEMGMAADDYLADWRRQVLGIGLLAATLLLVFGYATLRMRRNDALIMAAQRQILESDARFRHFFQKNSSVMLLIEPASGLILEANKAAASYYGYTIGQLTGMPISRINTLPEEAIARERALALHEERNYFHFPHRLASGELRDVEVHATPVETNGKVLLFSIVHDITARKQTEAELLRSNTELEQFSYSISHDMRQPLRMISSYLQLLQKALGDTLDGEKREYFHFAIDGAQRMDAMLRGLLDYSRIGRKGEPPMWLDSRSALDDALLFLRPLVNEAQADVRIEGEWPSLFVSPDEFLRLLQNLIGNALKFRVAGRPPEVGLCGEVINDGWRLTITDNGVGIPPEQIERLFQVFQRLQSRAAYEGTGIGLALCRKIVEHHHGGIRAESNGADPGCRFIVELPLGPRNIGGGTTDPDGEPPAATNSRKATRHDD